MISTFTLAIWQQQFVANDHHLLMVFIGMVAIALLIQAICVIAGVVVLIGTAAKIKSLAEDSSAKLLPLVAKTHALVEDLSPKVSEIATHARDITATLRDKTAELGETVSQLSETVAGANLRARRHVQTADRIVGSTLTSTEEIKDLVVQGIRTPVRQMVGMVAGVRAGLETLITRRAPETSRQAPNHYAQRDAVAGVPVDVLIVSEE